MMRDGRRTLLDLAPRRLAIGESSTESGPPVERYRSSPRPRKNRPSVELLETRQLLASFVVTSVGDSGAGTLRDAITQANAASGLDAITFAIPGAGVHSIVPIAPLPDVTDPATIDGTTQPGYAGTPLIELNGSNINNGAPPPFPGVDGLRLTAGASVVKGLAIDRFSGFGLAATGDGNTIAANFIGTDAAGMISLKNLGGGISLRSRNNVVGGSTPALRNVISGNGGDGIKLGEFSTQNAGNSVLGNFIGTDATGAADLGNTGDGIGVDSAGNSIGGATGNVIAFNGGAGVRIGLSGNATPFIGNAISMNSIYSNGGPGIQFGEVFGAAFPQLTSAARVAGGTKIEGTINLGSPTVAYTIEFFSNLAADPSGAGEGRTFLGSATGSTNGNGVGTISTTLPVAVPVGQFITATVTSSANNTTRGFSNAIPVTSTEQADLLIDGFTFTFSPQTGRPLSYSLTVRNDGPSRSANTVVNDTLPLGATFLSASASQGTVPTSAPNGQAVFNLGSLNSGQTATITLTVIPTISGSSANVATVSDPLDSNNANNQSVIFVTVNPTPPPDLAIAGNSSPNPAAVGSELTYLFVVQNTSFQSPATGVVVTDMLPAGLTFLRARSSQGTVAVSGNTITTSLGTLPALANATVTIIVRPTAAGLISNAASVRSNEADPNSLNNEIVVNTTVNAAPPADLAVFITAAPQPAQVGRTFTYAVLVANHGPALATNVVLTDLLPDAASIVSITPSQGTASVVGGRVTANLGNLPVGATSVVTIVILPGAAGNLESRADVTSDQPDFNIDDNTSISNITAVADQVAPVIVDQKLTVGRRGIAGIVLTFSQALDPVSAADPSNYKIFAIGRNSKLPASRGTEVAIASVVYDPTTRSARITPKTPLAIGSFFRLLANGPGARGITNRTGTVLDGDRNGLPDGIYESLIGRGTHTRPRSLQVGVTTPKPPKFHRAARFPGGVAGKHTTINIVVNN